MNYRHAYHAGNFADVLKHAVLARLLKLLQRKEAPVAYIDSHSGVGLYDLQGVEAGKTGEWQAGIARLPANSASALLADYLQVVAALNPQGGERYYPGSPEVARQLLREQDSLQLCEKHPADFALLKDNLRADERVVCHHRDGWQVGKALFPTDEKRAVLLIDPPFEAEDEYSSAVQTLQDTIARMRQAVVVIWYPIKAERQLNRFYQQLAACGAPKLLRAELWVRPADNAASLNGSGLAIVNPPWPLEDDLKTGLPELLAVLDQGGGGYRLDWLIAEAAEPPAKTAAPAAKKPRKPRHAR
ncbi:23S rRNA (adenine(2030)-N(6))-methyltransferase RlmJ [Atopomonas sediminilitoris]|uniref:23S rRNA (adenine(2030)-N(6))-methyltransferase RlmJ n=1 Tax=Atopomonas sediminilitoris TaxID=2919919 RepID=UPI001F4DC658|nr:23S rRNA (adenine(2030)-N(6))-methyltransferase RlmJ [Atopomonas sediminilitoris]MCJ8170335.1 23S rRNA (adenine(2030)-N(6))-methyltransferase RlmJ [Atopomonas sediminilitoris]